MKARQQLRRRLGKLEVWSNGRWKKWKTIKTE